MAPLLASESLPNPGLSDPGCAPGLSSAHNCTRSYLGTHIGGTLAHSRIGSQTKQRAGGGLRGKVMEFSRASRRRLLDLLNSINRDKVPVPLFLTLTYPDRFPVAPGASKAHLRAFKERFRRRWGKHPAIWRLELQTRKSGESVGQVAPHYHILVFLDRDPSEMYEWLSRSWYEVVGSGDERHLRAGTRIERINSWRGVLSYAAKYMAKPEALQGTNSLDWQGRFWGRWYGDLLPIDIVEVEIPVHAGYKIRRHMARYAGIRLKRYANSSSFKAYVPHTVMVRLLRYYGSFRP